MSKVQIEVYGVPVEVLKVGNAERDKESSSLYVINRSKPRGKIHFSVPDGSGGKIAIQVPITPIPVDLTTQAAKTTLLSNPQFRSLVQQGYCVIVSEDDALKVHGSERGAEELARVYKELARGSGLAPDAENGKFVEPVININEDDGVSGFARQVAVQGSLGDGDQSEDAVIASLEARDGELTTADYEYIARESVYGRVKAFCADKAHKA